jgi:hypothetical protein
MRACLVGAIVAASALSVGADPGSADDARPRQIRVSGTDVVVQLWEGMDEATGRVRSHYAISRGDARSAPKATSYELRLRHGDFDPLADAVAPAIETGLEAGDDTGLYIVQFVTHPLEEYRAAVRDLGGTVHAFLARHSHVVQMDADVADRVATLPFVRWVGDFHPAYRVEESVREHAAADTVEAIGTHRYNIMVFESGMAQKLAVARRIEALGGFVHREHAGKFVLEATLSPELLLEVVRWDEVGFVDKWSVYETDMDIAREIGGANYLEIDVPEGYDGSGVRGEVIDAGFNLGHVDFASRPLILHTSVVSDSHGAATSGIVFGDGTGNPAGRGLLPEGQGMVAAWSLVGEPPNRYDHTGELVREPYNAVFQTASVGSARTFFYTTISAETDAALFDFDVSHCQSQSNAGNQDSRPQAWAKNIISGGGVRHGNTLDKGDDNWGGGASTGPATDGRVKPDLTHFYDNIFTTTTGSSTAYTSSFGGTSGATPIICGHVGLFYEMWADGIFGNAVDPGATVFDNRSHMTTAKAALINTAAQYDWTAGGPNSDLTRSRQGWGMPDLRKLYDQRFKVVIVDEDDVLADQASTAYTVFVDPGEPALKATMTYADPPGEPFSSLHRVNDLSLRVTSPDGDVYWGNNGLIEGLWSTPGGSANDYDTVENVFVENPEAGQWTVEVIAQEIVEDGHVETPEIDADYALVISGVREELPPLLMRLLDSIPDLVPPDTPVELEVEILDGAEMVVSTSELLYYRADEDDAYTPIALEEIGEGVFRATVPGAGCDDVPQFYMSAEGDGGTVVTLPSNAPESVFSYEIGEVVVAYTQDFETDDGWTVENEALEDGAWERGIPAGGGDRGDPPSDFDGSGNCFVTDNADDNSDVDGGPTRLISPRLDATTIPDPAVSYARWFTNDDLDADRLDVEISDDDGATWTLLESVPNSPGWQVKSFRIADFVEPNDQIRLRFSATDNPNDSVTEAAVDAIEINALVCEGGCVGDITGDGTVDTADLVGLLAAWGECPGCPEDLNDDATVDTADLVILLAEWGPCR